MPQGLFALVIFQIRSCIYVLGGLDFHPPIYTSHIAGMTSVCHHAQLFMDWGVVSPTFLLKLTLSLNPSNLFLCSS
jgi:hypothetical protein